MNPRHDESETTTSEAADLSAARNGQGRSVIRLILVVFAIVVIGLYTNTIGTIAVVAALVAMIMIHELGHFITAKMSGMKVTEYFLGFGPKLWSIRKGETEYGVKAIPAGGYVRIIGMNSLETVDPQDEPRTYRQGKFYQRVIVTSAGSVMHFVMAFLLLWSLFSFVGIPNNSKVEIAAVSRFDNSVAPAAKAGLQPGDIIDSANGKKITSSSQLAQIISHSVAKEVTLVVTRNGRTETKHVVPANANNVTVSGQPIVPKSSKPTGIIGVELVSPIQKMNPISAIGASATNMWSYSLKTIGALVSHFSPHGISSYVHQLQNPSTQINSPGASSRFESPVGIVRLASQAVRSGIGSVISLLFSINIFVGIFNLIPLLPLDGGHIAIAIYERIRSTKQKRYQVDIMKLMPVTYFVLTVIILLGVTALYLDITHPLSNPFG